MTYTINQINPVDEERNREIEEYFNTKVSETTTLLRPVEVEKVIRDCINTPEGVIPDSVFKMLTKRNQWVGNYP